MALAIVNRVIARRWYISVRHSYKAVVQGVLRVD